MLELPGRTPRLLAHEGVIVHDVLTQADYEAMKRATGHWRDTLLLMFLRNTGFRPVEVCRLTASKLGHQGGAYVVWVQRAKKRAVVDPEPVFLSPNLGQPLVEYARGQALAPADRIFGLHERQLREITYQAGLKAIGRRVQPKEFRVLYEETVSVLSARIAGFTPANTEIASKMLGHASARVTRQHYQKLTFKLRQQIQEAIEV